MGSTTTCEQCGGDIGMDSCRCEHDEIHRLLKRAERLEARHACERGTISNYEKIVARQDEEIEKLKRERTKLLMERESCPHCVKVKRLEQKAKEIRDQITELHAANQE